MSQVTPSIWQHVNTADRFDVKYKDQLQARDERGRTPLMIAAERAHLNFFRSMLESCSKEDLEATTNEGTSVLHYTTFYAAMHDDDAEIVRYLAEKIKIKKGYINPLNHDKLTPLDIASEKVAKVLRSFGGMLGSEAQMSKAMYEGNVEDITRLLNREPKEKKGEGTVQLPIGGPGDSGVAKLPTGTVVMPADSKRAMEKGGPSSNPSSHGKANVSIHEIIERDGYIKPSNLPKDRMSERNLEGLTPLMHAISKRRGTLVRSFLEVATKEDFEAVNDRDGNKTVFHYLAESSSEIFDIFVNGLSLQKKDVQERLGKSKASELAPEPKVKFIVWVVGKLHERYGKLDAKVVSAFLSVKFQIKYGAERIDSYLTKQGWNIFGWESIIRTNNSSQVAKFFRQNPKALKERNANGLTPLMFAIHHTYIESARWLIGCNLINKDDMEAVNPNCFNYAVLHYIVISGDIGLLKMFLFKLFTQFNGNCSPVATMYGTPSELVVSLSQSNPDPDRELYYKQALESLKTYQSNPPQTNFSSLPPMNVGVDDFVDANTGFTPLMKMLKGKEEKVLEAYLDVVTKVEFQAANRKDKNRSVFHYAYGLRNFKLLDALLAKARQLGVDLNKRDADGKNPLDYVLEQNKGNQNICDEFIMAFGKYGLGMTGEGMFAGTPMLSLSGDDPKQQFTQMRSFLDKLPKGPSLNADGEPWDAGIQKFFAQNRDMRAASVEKPKVEPREHKKTAVKTASSDVKDSNVQVESLEGLSLDESPSFADFDREHANLSSGIRKLNKQVAKKESEGAQKKKKPFAKTTIHRAAINGDYKKMEELSSKKFINKLDGYGKTALDYVEDNDEIEKLKKLGYKEASEFPEKRVKFIRYVIQVMFDKLGPLKVEKVQTFLSDEFGITYPEAKIESYLRSKNYLLVEEVERPSRRNPAPLGAGQGSNEISNYPYPSRISSLQGGVPQETVIPLTKVDLKTESSNEEATEDLGLGLIKDGKRELFNRHIKSIIDISQLNKLAMECMKQGKSVLLNDLFQMHRDRFVQRIDEGGASLLMLALKNDIKNKPVLTCIVKFFPQLVNKKNNQGVAPLHFAASKANHEALEVLLANAIVDINILDGKKHTALDYALDEATKKMLVKKGAKKGKDL